jgi:hypothetical protein
LSSQLLFHSLFNPSEKEMKNKNQKNDKSEKEKEQWKTRRYVSKERLLFYVTSIPA